MPRHPRGEVDIELNGQVFTLVFDYNAIADLEQVFGDDKSVEQLLFRGEGVMPGRRVLREAVRIGMEKKNRKKSSKEVGQLISATIENDPEAFGRIYEAVVRGIMAAHGMSIDEALADASSNGNGSEDTVADPPVEAPATGLA